MVMPKNAVFCELALKNGITFCYTTYYVVF